MPKTKFENIVFTLLMSFLMVYAMICYNIALKYGWNVESSLFVSLSRIGYYVASCFYFRVFHC